MCILPSANSYTYTPTYKSISDGLCGMIIQLKQFFDFFLNTCTIHSNI